MSVSVLRDVDVGYGKKWSSVNTPKLSLSIRAYHCVRVKLGELM